MTEPRLGENDPMDARLAGRLDEEPSAGDGWDDLDDDPLGDVLVEDDDEYTALAYFEGDTGTLDYDQRETLHALMRRRYISAERHPRQWATLLASETLIKSRLNDLFLDLTINRTYEVAFKTQAVDESGGNLPTLLRDTTHGKEETILMVLLRGEFFRRRQDGDSVVFIERSAMQEQVSGMRPESATNVAFDQRKTDTAIENLRKAGVLLKTDDSDRFRVAPVIEVLLPVQRLRALQAWLMGENGVSERHPVVDEVTAEDTGLLTADEEGEDR